MRDSSSYSLIDKAIHNLAFGPAFFQSLIMDIEETMHQESWKHIALEKPIFITSLPRAGTTILLETLFKSQNLATHTYRDMPFVLTPVLWRKFSHHFHQSGELAERAHGDGLQINENSPEAFEEVFWKFYSPGHYHQDHIDLWPAESAGLARKLKKHMRQIIAKHIGGNGNNSCRYISKNNANIARIPLLRHIFSDAFVLVPFRHPVEHAVSLWRQHNNFIKQHKEDKFTLKYMADIGHYEFGQLHRPIAFPLNSTKLAGRSPESLDYWLAYWISAFSYLVEQPGISWLSYEDYSAAGAKGIAQLAAAIELSMSGDEIERAGNLLRPAPPSRGVEHEYDNALADEALILYQRLLASCLLNC